MNNFLLIRFVVIFLLTTISLIDDLKNYKISNEIVIAGLVFSTGINLIEFFKGGDVSVYVLAGAVVFFVLYLIYVLGGIGAGDVKLLMIAGFLIGRQGILTTIVSFFVAGIIGIIGILLKKTVVKSVDIYGIKDNLQLHICHFSPAVLISEIIVFVWVLQKG